MCRAVVLWAAVWILAAVVVPALAGEAASVPDERTAAAYTRALIAEAALEDAVRSLRASAVYAEAAGVDAAAAREVVARHETTLVRLREILQADAPAPSLAGVDLAGALDLAQRSREEVAGATRTLGEGMRRRLGRWAARPSFSPLRPLDRRRRLADQLVLTGLGPQQSWPGWKAGPEAWEAFHALGFQAMSPWFGHYWSVRGSWAIDPARIPEVAGRLDAVGFPTLVWLEPEYCIDHLWGEIGEEMYLHDAEGRWQKRTRINNTINVFHPRVRQEMCRWLRRVAAGHRGDDRILGYELIEEPALRFDTSGPGSAKIEARLGGYSKAARAAFRERLRAKYRTVAALNARWGSDYASFAAVEPPAALSRREGEWTGPEVALLGEFQEFRAAEHAECFRQMVAALRAGNPGRPVIPQYIGGLFGDPLGGVDPFRMAEAGWDILTFHTSAGLPYAYSVARCQGKPVWNDEYIWTANSSGPPFITPREVGERKLRARAAIELWRNLMWGARGFVLFNLDFAWSHAKDGGDWNNDLLNALAGNRIPRYAAAVFPQVLPKAATFLRELAGSEVEDEGVMMLEPTTSLYTAVPTGTVQWWGRRLATELAKASYRPAFCPERYVISGREDLSRVRVLVVPRAPYLPDAVAGKLAAWVAGGGTLVSLAPFATHDAFGHRRRATAPFAGDPPGQATAHGKGRHVSLVVRGTPDQIAQRVREAVDAAVGQRAATTSDARLEVMLRRTRGGGRVLVVLNTDPENHVRGEAWVAGGFRRVTDLAVEGGMGAPLQERDGGAVIPVSLDPGEARVLLCSIRPRPSRSSRRPDAGILDVAWGRGYNGPR